MALLCHGADAANSSDAARSASVSNVTSVSSCTSADEETSSSDPSSALAASPALLSISSAIRASMVCAAMMRHAVTGSVWPMRWTAVDGLRLLRGGPGELGEHDVRGDLEVQAHAGGGERADRDGDVGVVDERVDVVLAHRCASGRRGSRSSGRPRRAKVASAASITSMCLAKKTTLPALRAS